MPIRLWCRFYRVGVSAWAAILGVAVATPAHAQTSSGLMLDPWLHEGFGETVDRPLYQAQAKVDDSAATTQIFWWDSVGRFRLAPSSDTDPRLGYRYLTINFDSFEPTLPDTLDELSLAFGVNFGQVQGGALSGVFGVGYSGDNLFADADGLYGIGHLLWERPLNDRDSLLLSLDYDRSGGLLPDVPLPGFAFSRRDESLAWSVGFPRSSFEWDLTPDLTLSARYAVPLTADARLEQRLGGGISVYGAYSSFLNGFFLDGEAREDRFFLQMQRVEVGLRYIDADVLGWGLYLDAALSVGYVLDQSWSRGFDARSLESLGSTEATPYIGLTVVGRF